MILVLFALGGLAGTIVGCLGPEVALGGSMPGGTAGTADEPDAVDLDCPSDEPLKEGDASWGIAPFAPPGTGDDDDDDDDDGDDDGDDGDDGGPAGGFITMQDGGGISFECDLFAQDCPRGEKCMPWSNNGDGIFNATRCSPIAPDPAPPGDPCTVEGDATSGLDNCDIGSMCWNVDARGAGTCVAMCTGSADNPVCDDDAFCHQGEGGTPVVCLPNALCEADGVCRCLCPDDPDCRGMQCGAAPPRGPEAIVAPRAPSYDEPLPEHCPETAEPVVLYMSNDDSNSQASPILARRTIREGRIVPPALVRIHEFLNYYDVLDDTDPQLEPARVGMQMRRTHAQANELTLVLFARGMTMTDAERPPMNLVFSLDTSGSMSGEPIELLRETMRAIAGSLREGDRVSMVSWSSTQNAVLQGHAVSGPLDPTLITAIDALAADGGTDLHAGLLAAYQLAAQHRIGGGINRVILVSDGGANLGVTDIDVIASATEGADDDAIYLVGVGVGSVANYRDDLMNAATDAGKGAYVFIDGSAEAHRQFGGHFLANVAVSARNVRMQLTLPWYFGVRAFHGEAYSGDPAEVDPQHLAPNDAMVFHQIIAPCDASLVRACDPIRAQVSFEHPITGEAMTDELVLPIGELVGRRAAALRKADAIVGYAKALIVIGSLVSQGEAAQATALATAMVQWLKTAAESLEDAELHDIAALMDEYATLLSWQ